MFWIRIVPRKGKWFCWFLEDAVFESATEEEMTCLDFWPHTQHMATHDPIIHRKKQSLILVQ
jgi:hypothetical protein